MCTCLFFYLYSSEDFSDYNEEDEDNGVETIIVKGVQGECKENGEGKYRYVRMYDIVCIQLCIYSS